jgi:hypothetical protein
VQRYVEPLIVVRDLYQVMTVLYYHAFAKHNHTVPIQLRWLLALSEAKCVILFANICTLSLAKIMLAIIS